ncbi:MAG TPA: PilZ domain-containing protein, partial [Anaeromyxobacteraceae bacterium]|nr:PilZ domain-containing protein [Anaeromyxobacteraceae bacterium]
SVASSTINVSEGGCSLAWPDDLPTGGEVVTLKISDGFFAPTIRAVVCWNSLGGPGDKSVGLRILVEGRGGRAWRDFVESVARSGARAT